MPESAPAQSSPLFKPTAADWAQAPEQAFDHWMYQQGLNGASSRVYRAIWGKYLGWLTTQRIAVSDADAPHIAEFLRSLGSAVRRPQRLRYHRLLERVYDAIRHAPLTPSTPVADVSTCTSPQAPPSPNPASIANVPEYAGWRIAPQNEHTVFLDIEKRQALIDHLDHLDNVIVALKHPECLSADEFTAASSGPSRPWRALRGRALFAVFLGAGLKLHEALSLRFQDLELTTNAQQCWLRLQSASSRYSHQTVIEGQMLAWFLTWLRTLAVTTGLPHERLCASPPSLSDILASPTLRSRHVFAASFAGDGIQIRTAQRALVQVLDAKNWHSRSRMTELFHSGLPQWPQALAAEQHHIDPQALRNSCAANWFEQGTSLDLVMERLGYSEPTCAYRLFAAWREQTSETRNTETTT